MKATKITILSLCLLIVGAMSAPIMAQKQQNQVVTPPPIEVTSFLPVSVYTGTITNGSQTALYVYVPKYTDSYDSHTIYGYIVTGVAPEYAAIMPDAEYLSTPMKGFLVYATAGNYVTLDAEEGAEAFDNIMNLGEWSDITNAAAYLYTDATPSGAPQSSVGTERFLTGESWETSQEFAYVDGILTAITTYQQTLYYSVLTITDQSLTVSGISTSLSDCASLLVWVENSTLHISGLTAGQPWSVYNVAGTMLYQGIAVDTQDFISLQNHGVYIVKSGNNTVKTFY